MNALTFQNVFDVITVFLLLFFSCFLVTLRKGNRTGHRLLAVFLVALAMSYLDGVYMLFGPFIYTHFPHAFYTGLSFELLVGPALFLYIRSRTRPGFALRPVDALHALPFVGHALFMTVRYHIYTAEAKRSLLQAGTVLSHTEIVVLTIVAHLHFSVYAVVVLRALAAYRAGVQAGAAPIRGASPAGLTTWLTTATAGLFLIWSLRFLNSFLWLQVPDWGPLQYVDVRPFIVVGLFVFACVLVFTALRQPEVVQYEERIKYGSAQLPTDTSEAYAERLRGYMERDKPYLDPDLDLKALADGVAIPPHHLSQVLNGALNQNFFDFVNGYRVRECQAILAGEHGAKKRITEVMYEAGFNSKSVFNTAFRKQTGMTPSQYRKEAAHAGKAASSNGNAPRNGTSHRNVEGSAAPKPDVVSTKPDAVSTGGDGAAT